MSTRLSAPFLAAMVLMLTLFISGCTSEETASLSSSSNNSSTEATTDDIEAQADDLRIVSMKGPTSVGLAAMMKEEQGEFSITEPADQVGPTLLQDKADIALVPANVAALLYQKTDGGIRVIDINTLGVLFVVTGDKTITSIDRLEGKTIYMTGKGTIPEYTLVSLLNKKNLSLSDVDIQFKSDPTEVAALIASDPSAIGILPQPYAAALTLKNANLDMTLNLAQEWEQMMDEEEGAFITGVTIARASFIDEHPELIQEFLKRHSASVAIAQNSPESIAQIVVDAGIIDNPDVALQAIPYCNVVCLTGEPMKEALAGYLNKLYEQNPASIGGALPGDNFYFLD